MNECFWVIFIQKFPALSIKKQKSCAGNFWMKINQKHLVYFEKWFIFWFIFGLFLGYKPNFI